MVEQELLFLGLLKDSPKHGYQIKKESVVIMSTFAGMDTDSIYYPLQSMERRGLIAKTRVPQKRRPQRYVYRITDKGRARFKELLSNSILKIDRPYFSFDLSLYFIKNIPRKLTQHNLKARARLLNHLKRNLLKAAAAHKKSPLSLRLILEHNLKLLEAEIKFLFSLQGQL